MTFRSKALLALHMLLVAALWLAFFWLLTNAAGILRPVR